MHDMCMRMWIVTEGAGMELSTMVDLLKADRRLGLLDKNYAIGSCG